MRGRYIAAIVAIALSCSSFVTISAAHEGHDHEHAHARSDPTPGRVTAHDIAELHERHGHEQYHGGAGDPGHTWASFRQQARALNEYLRRVAYGRLIAFLRAALVWRWSGVADCESGGNWAINTGNGYYGGLQFSLSTWRGIGGRGLPHQQPAWYQAAMADKLRVSSGLHHWPVCGSRYR